MTSHRLDEGQFRDGTNIRPIIVAMRPTSFWCNGCQRWTDIEPWTEDDGEAFADGVAVTPICGRCGEEYVCDECGHIIDERGNCLREGGHEPAE